MSATATLIAATKDIIPTIAKLPVSLLNAPTAPLSKALVKKQDSAAVLAIVDAFAEDEEFLELAAAETSAGKRIVAQQLIDSFKLALKNPTPEEIKVSLTASLGVLVAAAKAKKPTPAAAVTKPLSPTSIVERSFDFVRENSKKGLDAVTATAKRLPGLAPSPLSKPLIKKSDSAAAASIVAAFGDDPAFAKLVNAQVEADYGKWKAAQVCS